MWTSRVKGRRVDNGAWVTGFFVPSAHETEGNASEAAYCYICNTNPLTGKVEAVEVVRDSIGKFAGYFDKNGEPVYENDIVRFTNKCGYSITEVAKLPANQPAYPLKWSPANLKDCVIVGNIRNYMELKKEERNER